MMPLPIPPPGPHGGDGPRLAAWLGRPIESILDLSMSINPCPPDVGALVAEHRSSIRHYPDGAAATAILAAAIGVDEERVVLTNGGAEAIALVAQVESTGDVIEPEFSLYRRHLRTLTAGAPRWRSNPGNPTGRLAPADARAAVWDEAFYPLSTGAWTRGDDDAWRLGSLTKLWACPGLRIGYVVAPDVRRASTIRDLQPRWSVGALALAAVEQLVPATDLESSANRISVLRASLAAALRRRSLIVDETDAPWVLVRDADLRGPLAARGVLVRDCGSFGLPGTVRVAVPDDDGRRWLLDAIDEVLDQR